VAALGASIYVLSGLTSLVTQQSISYIPTRAALNNSATIPATRYWGLDEVAGGLPRPRIDAAVLLGISAAGSSQSLDAIANCSSADCTFPMFDSLAICTETVDITSYVEESHFYRTNGDDWSILEPRKGPVTGDVSIVQNITSGVAVSLPNGLQVALPPLYTIYTAPVNKSVAFAPQDDRYLARILDMMAITVEPRGKTRAYEMLFHVCVNTYAVSVNNGSTTTNVIASHSISHTRGSGVSHTAACADNSTCPNDDDDGAAHEDEHAYISFEVSGVNYSMHAASADYIGNSIARHLSGWICTDTQGASVYGGLLMSLFIGAFDGDDRFGFLARSAAAGVNRM